jgi:hypothetical protein
MPKITPRPLYRAERKRFAGLLGLDALPDACADGIAWLIAAHQASRKLVKGHTTARVAAALRRAETRMHRGHDAAETTRTITDPQFGLDVETFTRLQSIVGDAEVPLDRRLAAIEARRREVEALPEIDSRHGLRVVLVAQALAWIWYFFAADRDDESRQWLFVLAILEAAGELTARVRKNPERLKRLKHDVGRLSQLTSQPAGRA